MDQRTHCPRCGSQDIRRDEADVGVGIIYGPYGCPDCGWCADAQYDLSGPDREPFDENGILFDQWGGLYPAIKRNLNEQ